VRHTPRVPDTATILTSAGVAASTTLLIEFVAKPRLEIRKDRILQRFRDKESVLKQLTALSDRLTFAGLESVIGTKSPQDIVESLYEGLRTLSAQQCVLSEYCPPALFQLVEYELIDATTTVNLLGLIYRRAENRSGDGTIPWGVTEVAMTALSANLGHFGWTAAFLRLPRWRWMRRCDILRAATRRYSSLNESEFEQLLLDRFYGGKDAERLDSESGPTRFQ
jgi:hypothetical protein